METKVPDEIVPGVYQHYKGPKYLVHGCARHSNTEERGVVYMPLEPHGDELPQLSWRPVGGVDGFYTPVQIDGEWKERFTFLYAVHSTKVERQKME